jgi:hypothetical protein
LVILVFLMYFGHFNKLEYFCHFLGSEVILVILGVWCQFGHYGVSRVILVILEFSGLFWSFFRFKEYFIHYGIFGVILVILEFQGYFGHFDIFGVF